MSEITQTITEYSGTVPDKDTQTPSEFSTNADQFVQQMTDWVDEYNDFASQANSLRTDVNTWHTQTESAKETAVEAANATVYSASTTYDAGDIVLDPNDSYRSYTSQQDSNTGHTPSSDDGTWWVRTTVASAPEVKAKTSDYTITTLEVTNNVIFTNKSATASVNFDLPAATAGMVVSFEVRTAQYLKCTADGTDTFEYAGTSGAAGGYVRSNEVGTSWRLECREAGKWSITQLVGILNYDE